MSDDLKNRTRRKKLIQNGESGERITTIPKPKKLTKKTANPANYRFNEFDLSVINQGVNDLNNKSQFNKKITAAKFLKGLLKIYNEGGIDQDELLKKIESSN